MQIKVDRIIDSKQELVFTITVSEPQVAPFPPEEFLALGNIEAFLKTMEGSIDPNGKLYQDILNANHKVKENVFFRVLSNLKFSIKNQLEPKFNPICQEIYNWIYDQQEGILKQWMTEFDPQRTTYYFDNDGKLQSRINSDLYPVDKDEDDEDLDEDEEEDEDDN